MFTFAFSLRCVFASSILMINALVVGRPACRPDQIRALVQFKNEFESRGCNNSDYFHGVMCDNTTGAVTKLKLPSGLLNWNSQTQQLPFRAASSSSPRSVWQQLHVFFTPFWIQQS
ncbi:unnamed protein product [Brassica oleracea]|uniref:(rape) hypothetical protein n=2 Tax=Brassica napus TaxID=3708 RepID=A0A816JD21_BRANA|nr:unnamed protein product [Brassica napus]